MEFLFGLNFSLGGYMLNNTNMTSMSGSQEHQPRPPNNYFGVIDEDISIITPEEFALAKRRCRRNRRETQAHCTSDNHHGIAYRHDSIWNPSRGEIQGKAKNVSKFFEHPKSAMPMPLVLSCPICLDKLVEETTTKCGHIFCKKCIESAMKVQRKCPTCRRKLRKTDTFRIYLPVE